MLVLSRKIGETIIINNHIRITVVTIRGGHVRLGIAAPDEVTVDRLEVHEKRRNPTAGWAKPETWSYSCQETP